MEFTDTQSSLALTADQIERLLVVIIDVFGSGLSQHQFNDEVLGLLEDVAGFETIPRQCLDATLQAMWNIYWRRCGGVR